MNIGHSGHNHENLFSHLLEEVFENFGLSHELSEFFLHLIADTVSIFLLLFFIMFFVSFLQTFINYDKLKEKLVKLNNIWVYFLAVGLGAISPFCSCTIVPVLIGLVNLGIPTSVAICYFTSSSLLNVAAIVTMYASTGLSFTLLYIVSSFIIILVVSILMSRFKIKDESKIYRVNNCCEHSHTNIKYQRLHTALHNTMHVFRGAWIFILIGVAISSATLIFIPLDKITEIINLNFSVLLVALIGLPIHSDVFTILPILLMLKEISTGVALTFALATMTISIPSAILLSRAFKVKYILVYAAILFVLSVLIGYAGVIFI